MLSLDLCLRLICGLMNQQHLSLIVPVRRLLHAMILANLNCTELTAPDDVPPAARIYDLCAQILVEWDVVARMGFPNALKDLFIEQSK